jgi:hypothetical protein
VKALRPVMILKTTARIITIIGQSVPKSFVSVLNQQSNAFICIWDVKEHKQEHAITNGDCCFNHIIGLVQLYSYEPASPYKTQG